jgi:hypothetical protein
LRIFFRREGTHQYRYRFPGKSVERGEKIDRGRGEQVPGIFPGVGGFELTIKGFFFWVAQSSGRQADYTDR